MSGVFNLLNKLGILSAARRLNWSAQAATTGKPGSAIDGVTCAGALFSMVHVQVREQPSHRTTRITFGSFTALSEYTVALNGGTPVAIEDAATIEATVAAAVTAINASANTNTIVVATAELRSGVWTLVLRGISAADYSCAVAVTLGSGTIAASADATSAEVAIFVKPDGLSTPTSWSLFPGSAFTVTPDNLIERFRTAGMQRVYVQATFTGGAGTVFIAPAIEE